MPNKPEGSHKANRLSVARVRSAKPGTYYDGNGLCLVVDESGAGRWIQRLTIRGKRRDMGLGSASLTSLGEARDMAFANRKLARAGGDPIEARKRRQAPSFETAARECFEDRSDTWRNEKHRAQWLSTMETYVFPKLGSKRVDDISTSDLLDVLTPIWTKKAETARRVRQRIGLVLDWSKAKGWRDTGSPTREIGKALPTQARTQRHQPAMPFAEVPAFLARLAASGAVDATKAAMEILILCAARTGEVLGAKWPELDLKKAIWTIPGDRMKGGRPHSVPLTARAVELFSAMRAAHSGKGDLVFEAAPGKPLSQMTLLQVMRRFELTSVPHGFRSSFRDFAAERTSAPREVAEAALAHTLSDKVEAAYRRSDLFDKRRKLMVQWGAHCAGGGKVVHLAARRSA